MDEQLLWLRNIGQKVCWLTWWLSATLCLQGPWLLASDPSCSALGSPWLPRMGIGLSIPLSSWPTMLKFFFFFFNIYLLWLCQVLFVAHGIFVSTCGIFSCGVWDLVPWPEIQPGPHALGVWSLATGPPGKSPTTPNFHHRLSFLMSRFWWQSTYLLFLPSPDSLSKCITHKQRRVNLFTALMIKLACILPSNDRRVVYSLSWYSWGIGSRTPICGCQSLCVVSQFSLSVVSDSLRPHESQHVRPPCLSPTPRVYSNPCPSSRWCHPAISSSVVPFSSCPQSLLASGSFSMSQHFAWGGQSIGVSASASVLPMNTQDWSPLGRTGWISLQFKGLSRVFSNITVQKHQFFGASFLHSPNLTSIHDH